MDVYNALLIVGLLVAAVMGTLFMFSDLRFMQERREAERREED